MGRALRSRPCEESINRKGVVMFKKIVWATDGSEAADQALEIATRMASEAGGEVLAVHCIEMTFPGKATGRVQTYADEDDVKTKIERQTTQLSADGVPARMEVTHVEARGTAPAVAEIAREQNGEVIVVGTRGHGPIAGVLLGSVTQRLLHDAPCPVLVVPHRNGSHE